MRWGERWRHLLYLALFGLVGAFVLSFFAVTMAEGYGPSEVDEGRVVHRIDDEYTSCPGNTTSSCRELKRFTLVGERTDGSSWSVNGDSPYRLFGRGDRVDVETSTVTGRVVGLSSEEESWKGTGVGWTAIAVAFVGLALMTGISMEYGRRNSDSVPLTGPFWRSDFAIVPPAILLGIFAVWYPMFGRAPDLSGLAARDELGTFVSDSLDFDIRADGTGPAADDDGHVVLGRYGGGELLRLVVVPLADLSPDVAGPLQGVPSGTVAVPLIGHESSRSTGPVEFLLVESSTRAVEAEEVDCPESLVEYGTVLGEDRDVVGGFVCFDADEVGATTVMSVRLGDLIPQESTFQLER